jgi:hypothetical protein
LSRGREDSLLKKINSAWYQLCKRWQNRIRRQEKREAHVEKHKKRGQKRRATMYQKRGTPCTYISVAFPRRISLTAHSDRSFLLTSIQKLHMAVKRGSRRIQLNFAETKIIFPAGMLLLYAELKNLLALYPNLSLKYLRPQNQRSAQVFVQLGLAKIFGERRKIHLTHKDVVHWRVAEGSGTEGQRFSVVVGGKSPISPEVNLYGGFIEAAKNVRNHAYISQRSLSTVNTAQTEWWIFSQIRDGFLTMVICDLGIGIPITAPKKRPKLIERLLPFIASPTDADIILATIEGEKSRTGEDFRGNGLPTIAAVAKTHLNASFAAYSNNGAVLLLPHRRREERKLEKYDYTTSINGTIIEWKLPITEKHHETESS